MNLEFATLMDGYGVEVPDIEELEITESFLFWTFSGMGESEITIALFLGSKFANTV